jgi:hypothetical protein
VTPSLAKRRSSFRSAVATTAARACLPFSARRPKHSRAKPRASDQPRRRGRFRGPGAWRAMRRQAGSGRLQFIDETGEPYRWPAVARERARGQKTPTGTPRAGVPRELRAHVVMRQRVFPPGMAPAPGATRCIWRLPRTAGAGRACSSASLPTSAQKHLAGITRRIARHLLSSASIQPRHAPVREGSTWRVVEHRRAPALNSQAASGARACGLGHVADN